MLVFVAPWLLVGGPGGGGGGGYSGCGVRLLWGPSCCRSWPRGTCASVVELPAPEHRLRGRGVHRLVARDLLDQGSNLSSGATREAQGQTVYQGASLLLLQENEPAP